MMDWEWNEGSAVGRALCPLGIGDTAAHQGRPTKSNYKLMTRVAGSWSKGQGKCGAFAAEAFPVHPESLDQDQLGVGRNAGLVEGDF